MNHAARQPELGNNCIISPPSLGASPPCRKSPREETTGPVRPLRKGKYPGPTDRPQRPSRPQIMGVFESRGLVGWKAGRTHSCRGHTRSCLYGPPAPAARGANTSGTGRVGLREVRLHSNNRKQPSSGFVPGGLSQCLALHLPRNRCQAIGQYFVIRLTKDKRREQRLSHQASKLKKKKIQAARDAVDRPRRATCATGKGHH